MINSKRLGPGVFVIALFVLSTHALSASLRDPTTPLDYRATGSKTSVRLDLQAIFWQAGKPTAVINGTQLARGQSLAGWTITQITSDRVLLNSATGQRELTLRRNIIKNQTGPTADATH